MGGQACVFYGAAEFSRDLDLLVLADPENLVSLRAALDDLNAELVAVPPFEARHLLRGHAVRFRCRRPDVAGLLILSIASTKPTLLSGFGCASCRPQSCCSIWRRGIPKARAP
jgi:hypothetical protein